jgi:DNA repair exonuclease SbcCD nuclease subunit
MGASLGFVSDTHFEVNRSLSTNIRPTSDFLALCGDVGDPFELHYRELLIKASFNFEKTVYIAGNHEYHGSDSMEKTIDQLYDISHDLPNVEFLHRDVTEMNGYLVAGATLWTKRPDRASTSNATYHYNEDYNRRINKEHVKDLTFLEDIVSNPDYRKIILTHHIPSYRMCVPKYKNSPGRSLFYNDLEYLLNSRHNIRAWLCGHSHCKYTRLINGTPCCINAHGHSKEGAGDEINLQVIDI